MLTWDYQAIAARPGAQRGITIPEDTTAQMQDEEFAKRASAQVRSMLELGKPA
jgi:GST-like protein